MNWLSSAWSRNRDWLGNAAKNISPFLALTPLGLPAAFGAAALGRGVQHGATLGNVLKSGAGNAAIGAGLQGGAGLLRSAFNPSSSAAAASYGGGGGAAGGEIGGQVMGAGNAFTAGSHAASAGGGGGFGAQVGSALKGIGSFAAEHPKALEMGLGALDPSERNYRDAMTRNLNTRTDLDAQQMEEEKRRRQALGPLWQALAGQFQNYQNNPMSIASNPYR